MATDGTLIQIRERSLYDLLELALVVVRHRPLPLLLAAAAGILPWAVLNSLLTSEEPEFGYGHYLLLAMEVPWATAPLTVMLGGLMFGDRPRARRIIVTLFRALPSLLVYQGLMRAFLLLFLLPSALLPSKLAFLNEVTLLERGRFRSIPGRSWRLSGERAGDLFFQWVAYCAFAVGFVVAFRFASERALAILFGQPDQDGYFLFNQETPAQSIYHWLFDVHAWTAHLAIWLVVAFGAVVRFLTYIDRRIRLEGWEVELRLRMVGASMENSDRW